MNISALIRHAANRGEVKLADGQRAILKCVKKDGRRRADGTYSGQARVIFFDGRERTVPLKEVTPV